MKFNKVLNKHIEEYKHIVPSVYWFEYKKIKKLLNKVLEIQKHITPAITDTSVSESADCCICLENTAPMMQTFCCHNVIHHKCIVDSILHTSITCPLCREDFQQYFKNPPTTRCQAAIDCNVLSMISWIYLNIMKIENVWKHNWITDEKIKQHYITQNYTALIKICKKIKKCINIDLQDYFLDIVKKHKILPEYTTSVSVKHKKNKPFIKQLLRLAKLC